jgi:hypothetical protein
MSRLDAERIARLYEGFYAEKPEPFSGPIPRCVLEPIQDRDHWHTSPLEFVAGCAVLALVAFVFGVIL